MNRVLNIHNLLIKSTLYFDCIFIIWIIIYNESDEP